MSKANQYKYEKNELKEGMRNVSSSALVQVLSFDSSRMTVDVQPLSKALQNGSYQTPSPILSVPVAYTKSGGYVIRPWINSGDTGCIIYIDHDIDKTVGGSESEPNTERNHSKSDAVFVGGIVTDALSGLPDNALVLARDDGSLYVAVTEDKISIKGETEIEGNVKIIGDLVVTGTITEGG